MSSSLVTEGFEPETVPQESFGVRSYGVKSLNFFSGVIDSVEDSGDDGGNDGISIIEDVPESVDASSGSLRNH